MVYDVTRPNNHKMSNTTAMVYSMISLSFFNLSSASVTPLAVDAVAQFVAILFANFVANHTTDCGTADRTDGATAG